MSRGTIAFDLDDRGGAAITADRPEQPLSLLHH